MQPLGDPINPPAFELFGPAHLCAILVTVSAPFVLALLAREPQGLDRAVRLGLAVILAVNFIGYGMRASLSGAATWQQSLPFQLCDWTTAGVIVACLNGGRPRWLEVIYFWGIGGSLQAVLTPNLPFGFPDYRFITFFVDHCGIVVGVAYLMLTRRFRPRPASLLRVLAWSEFYLVVTLIVDHITGVNYGFLLHKPEAFSILSYLSDSRPIYLMQLNLLAFVFFALLYAPFLIGDCLRGRRVFARKQIVR